MGKALQWKYRWVSAAGTGKEDGRKEAPRTSPHLIELGMFKMAHPEKLIGCSVQPPGPCVCTTIMAVSGNGGQGGRGT